mgnify:CR=1 FL=1
MWLKIPRLPPLYRLLLSPFFLFYFVIKWKGILRCCFIFSIVFLVCKLWQPCDKCGKCKSSVWNRTKCPVCGKWQVATVASVANWLAWGLRWTNCERRDRETERWEHSVKQILTNPDFPDQSWLFCPCYFFTFSVSMQ